MDQSSKSDELDDEIDKLDDIDVEHEITQPLQKQNKKLDTIEQKLNDTSVSKSNISDSDYLKHIV